MRSINKKGLSDLLAVVLMIGMSAVALTLLGTFLFGLSEQTAQFAPAVSCFEMNSKIESVCYKEQELQIELKRGIGDEGINSFEFSIESSGNSNSYFCGEECSCIIPKIGETKILNYGFPTMPEKVTLFANKNCKLGTKKVVAC